MFHTGMNVFKALNLHLDFVFSKIDKANSLTKIHLWILYSGHDLGKLKTG